jgi:HAD superfamily hydrolase (TIGR01509 family)
MTIKELLVELLVGVEAIIFDLDGTLVDSEIWKESEIELLRSLGVKKSEEEIRALTVGFLPGRDQRAAAIFYRQKFSLNIPPSEIRKRRLKILKRLIREKGVSLMPGAKELLELLKGRFKLALCSSSPPEIIKLMLKNTGISQYFSVIVSGEELPESKPHPQPFLETARRLGVAKSKCLVIEDSIVGVAAAKTAGMKCVQVFNKSNLQPDLCFQTLLEIKDLWQEIEGAS